MTGRLRLLSCLLCSTCVMAVGGCAGYQVGAGAIHRPDIRTVHVQMFQSDTFRRNLGERVTEAVIKEIELNTPYKVVHSPSADSVLTGRILSVSDRKRVIGENKYDEPREVGVDMVARVNWYDRRGEAILQDCSFVLAPVSFFASENSSFVPEGGQSLATAQQEAIRRLARQIVSQMESPW